MRRRIPQRIRGLLSFNLRSFLIALTIVCAVLGTWIRNAVEQHRIVEQLTAGPASVIHDYQYENFEHDCHAQPLYSDWFADGWFGEDWFGGDWFVEDWLIDGWGLYLFHSVKHVRIGAMFHTDTYDRNGGDHTYDDEFLITEETYALLKSLSDLRSLTLNAANMTNDELKYVAEIRTLEKIGLEAVPIDGSGLAYLAKLPRLKSLILSKSRLADDNLDGLLKIRTLKSVFIRETFVTPEGAERVRKALPKCKVYY